MPFDITLKAFSIRTCGVCQSIIIVFQTERDTKAGVVAECWMWKQRKATKNKRLIEGQRCGSVGRVATAGDTRDPGSNPVVGKNLYIEHLFVNCQLYWKDENKGKRGLEWPKTKSLVPISEKCFEEVVRRRRRRPIMLALKYKEEWVSESFWEKDLLSTFTQRNYFSHFFHSSRTGFEGQTVCICVQIIHV